MKIAYKIFHLERGGSSIRDSLFYEATKFLDQYFDRLETRAVDLVNQPVINRALEKFMLNYTDFKPISSLKIGEVGIWASNYLAWNKLLSTDYDAILLCEDDIFFSSDFYESLINMTNELPDDWDFFSPYYRPKHASRYKADEHWYSDNICRSFQGSCNLCYLISRKGASKSLSLIQDGIFQPVDLFIYDKKIDFKRFTINPNLTPIVSYVNLPTTIHNTKTVSEIRKIDII